MTDELQTILAQLELLRRADDNLFGRGRPNWEAQRRLAIHAECCTNRGVPLIEVMNTEPRCVLVTQAAVGKSKQDNFGDDRQIWQGIGYGGQGFAWQSTFEAMAGTNLQYHLWCRHQRWYVSAAPGSLAVSGRAVWIPLDDVLHKRGHTTIRRNTDG